MEFDRDLIVAALPGYRIAGELGRGAFGVVFEAHHRQLDRPVAVKLVDPALAADPEVRSRFVAEARLLAGLDHPHIVRVYDFVERDGLCLLVMERLSGGTVRQHVSRGGVPMQTACALMLAACAGLHSAHQHSVLHRDVKPENLMFSGSGTLKVTDFGIAKMVGGTTMTAAGSVLGTPAYMAPEQITGSQLGPATDVYSAGTVLYELLAGDLPLSAEGSYMSVLYRHVHEDPVPLRQVAPLVPEPISDAIMRSLSVPPGERYPSAESFGLALAAAATEAWGHRWLQSTGRVLLAEGPILFMLQDTVDPGAAGRVPVRATVVEGPVPAPATRPPSPPPPPSPPSPPPRSVGDRVPPATRHFPDTPVLPIPSPPTAAPPPGSPPRRGWRPGVLGVAVAVAVVAAVVGVVTSSMVRAPSPTPTTTAPTTTAPGPRQVLLPVPGTQAWTDTGIDVTPGDRVAVTATGTVFNNDTLSSDPDGMKGNLELRAFNVLPDYNHGSLIGRIGQEQPFNVGGSAAFVAPTGGRLFLGVNDRGVANNSGAYTVSVTVTRR